MNSNDEKLINRGALKYMARAIIAPVFMGLLYFLAAGSTDNTRAWIYFILFFVLSFGTNSVLYVKNKELLYHRSKLKPDAVGWDKWLMPLALLTSFHLQSIIMGLETRANTPQIEAIPIFIGVCIYVFSFVITALAMLVNQHFEANVRIQKDRDHNVVSTGPYSVVRHPGYLAFILATFAIPLIIGSTYGFINAFIGSILILFRTYKEDNTLKEELNGYENYAAATRYRILPGVW